MVIGIIVCFTRIMEQREYMINYYSLTMSMFESRFNECLSGYVNSYMNHSVLVFFMSKKNGGFSFLFNV